MFKGQTRSRHLFSSKRIQLYLCVDNKLINKKYILCSTHLNVISYTELESEKKKNYKMKPDTASRLLYQEAALRSFLRSDNIAQSFIQNTPNYNMDDLQQLYFASASIKSKKMLIEFVKISTKQLCLSLRDRLPLFKYLNPDNISTDLTDDELMLLIHEASHSMTLDKQIGSHGNIAFLVAKNIIFNLVGVNATATLNSFLKTPDLGSFSSRNNTFDPNLSSFEPTDHFSKPMTSSSPPFPMPPPASSQFPMQQSTTSLSSPPASTSPPPPAYMPSYGSSPTIISTSVANLSFVSMSSSMPENSNSFMTISTSTPPTTTHSVTQSDFTPAITEMPHNEAEPDMEPDFDTRSNVSGSSETRFEVIGNSGDSDEDNSRNDFDLIPTENDPGNRVDVPYGKYEEDDDKMNVESTHSDSESEQSDNNENEKFDDESGNFGGDNNNVDGDKNDNTTNNYQMMNNHRREYDDLYEQEQRSFEEQLIAENEMKRVFSIPGLDDESKDSLNTEEINDPQFNTPPSTPPPAVESPKKFSLRKKPRKRKASRYDDDDNGNVNNKKEEQNEEWLDPGDDFELRNGSLLKKNKPIDNIDGGMITNINEVIKQSRPNDKKLFTDDGMVDIMNDLKRKGVLNIPPSSRNVTFYNIDS